MSHLDMFSPEELASIRAKQEEGLDLTRLSEVRYQRPEERSFSVTRTRQKESSRRAREAYEGQEGH